MGVSHDYINSNNNNLSGVYSIDGSLTDFGFKRYKCNSTDCYIGAEKRGEKMKQFIHDWIHLTQGEMFIKYWHLWLFIVLIVLLISIVVVWWHDDIFNQHRPKTLQERVEAQKEKELRDKLRTWERRVEPYLIKQGDSVSSILKSKKLYFSDDEVRKRLDYLYLRKLYPNRHFRGPAKTRKQ